MSPVCMYVNPFNVGVSAGIVLTTPVVATGSSANPSVIVNVPSGVDGLMFFVNSETSGAGNPVVTAIGNGSQSAGVVTGAEISAGAGPRLLSAIWYLVNPTPGSTTWNISATSVGITDMTVGYRFVTGWDTSDPFCHSAPYAVSTTTTTSRSGTVTTDAANAVGIGYSVGRVPGNAFTWSTGSSVYAGDTTASYMTIADEPFPTIGSNGMAGSWGANPTRSNLIIIALNPA